jgi:hypothetical protein
VASDSFEPGRAALPEGRTVQQPSEERAEPAKALAHKGLDFHPTSELPEIEETGTGWPDGDGDDDAAERRARRRYDDDTRRRWGRPTGCLFWLAGMVALVLVVGLVLKVAGLLPSFHNPFGSKTTDRSQPTLLLSIQDLARFEAAAGNFQEVIDVQKDKSFIPDIIFNDRTLFICVATVDAYVDFSHIGQGDIIDSPDHKTATINLPAPQLDKPNIDHEKSYVFATQQGLANKIGDIFSGNPNKEREMYLLGEQRIAQAARDSGLADHAATNTKQMLTQLLKSLGYTTITIKFAAP